MKDKRKGGGFFLIMTTKNNRHCALHLVCFVRVANQTHATYMKFPLFRDAIVLNGLSGSNFMHIFSVGSSSNFAVTPTERRSLLRFTTFVSFAADIANYMLNSFEFGKRLPAMHIRQEALIMTETTAAVSKQIKYTILDVHFNLNEMMYAIFHTFVCMRYS